MKIKTKILVDRSASIRKSIADLTSKRVLVGVPAAKAERESDDDHGAPQHINNAALAYIHDNGAPEAGIPARPFMRPGIEDAKPAIIKGFKDAGQAALNGERDRVAKIFNRIGLDAQIAIQGKISDGPFAPLKQATIEARQRRLQSYKRAGKKRRAKMMAAYLQETATPLIDTGQLKRSISYVILNIREK